MSRQSSVGADVGEGGRSVMPDRLPPLRWATLTPKVRMPNLRPRPGQRRCPSRVNRTAVGATGDSLLGLRAVHLSEPNLKV